MLVDVAGRTDPRTIRKKESRIWKSYLDHFQCNELVTLLLETGHYFWYESTLDTVRFDHEEGSLGSHFCGESGKYCEQCSDHVPRISVGGERTG